jgi:hypothetical protein
VTAGRTLIRRYVSTVHHWQDPVAGLREMRRVARRVVVFTYDASSPPSARQSLASACSWPEPRCILSMVADPGLPAGRRLAADALGPAGCFRGGGPRR